MMPFRSLAILVSPFMSGAEISFLEYIQNTKNVIFSIVLPKKTLFNIDKIPDNNKIVYLPLLWFKKTPNLFYYLELLINVIYVSFKLFHIVRKEKINIIYSNSFRSFIYTIPVSIFVPKIKNICHVRDNLSKKILMKFSLMFSDNVVCISEFIYNQVHIPVHKKKLIYNGIDCGIWKPEKIIKNNLHGELRLSPECILIAQIAQITPWKNQSDTIRLAEIVSKKYDIHFLIIGTPYSKIDQTYKKELETELLKRNLHELITIVDFTQNIIKYFNQIDILIHPSINEPFGKVLLEAMALEKPVVAYNCGAPKEIIINNQTGFLVEKNNLNELAEKTEILIKNFSLRKKFGEAGRRIVEQKFGMQNYINNMDDLFRRFNILS